MKRGDMVSIYHDPVTETDLEGRAMLLVQIDGDYGEVDRFPLERWRVWFEGDEPGEDHTRMILNTRDEA